MNKALIALFVSVALLATDASFASAKKKVVLMQFQGPKSNMLRKGVLKVLRGRFKIVGAAQFARTQRRLRARKLNKRNVAKVCKKMGVHGVVFGRVQRKRGKYRLQLSLRSGADGSIVETVNINLGRRPRITKQRARRIRRTLARAIDDLPNPGRARRDRRDRREEPERDDWEEEEVTDEGDDWEEETIREEEIGGDDRGGDGGDDGDLDADLEEESDGDDGEPLGKSELYDALARDRAVDIAAGLSVIGRNLTFDVAAGIADEPNGYSGTVVPGAYVQGELYPLAFDHKRKNKGSPMGNIGLSFVVDKVLRISSKLQGGTVDIPTSQLRWGIGARYRINLGSKPSSPTVKFGVGYNKLMFELDQQVIADQMLDIDLPNVAYTYFDPGIAGRLPVNREMALYADGRFLIITDTGDIQGNDAYGAATVSGLDLDAGLEYRFDARLLMRAGVRYQRIGFSFDGTGALNDRDGDGASDVSGATDQYFGGYATAGYLF